MYSCLYRSALYRLDELPNKKESGEAKLQRYQTRGWHASCCVYAVISKAYSRYTCASVYFYKRRTHAPQQSIQLYRAAAAAVHPCDAIMFWCRRCCRLQTAQRTCGRMDEWTRNESRAGKLGWTRDIRIVSSIGATRIKIQLWPRISVFVSSFGTAHCLSHPPLVAPINQGKQMALV